MASGDPWIGRLVGGRYEPQLRVSRSQMSLVYVAWDRLARACVAFKVAGSGHDGERLDDMDERLRREIGALARLRHRRIVRLEASGRTEDEAPYLVMEQLHGPHLGHVIDAHRRLPWPLAAALACQLLEGVGEIHRTGLLHRDLKPTNLILTEEGLKIIDFGLVLDLRATRGSRRLTSPGCVMGTPNYLSTEQCRGRADLDARADLYACGVILYEMLVGSPPFDAQMSCDVLQAHLGKPTPPFAEAAPRIRIPPALERVVMTSLEKDRRRRFRSAEEMRAALLDLKR